jgi:hypothetical protein
MLCFAFPLPFSLPCVTAAAGAGASSSLLSSLLELSLLELTSACFSKRVCCPCGAAPLSSAALMKRPAAVASMRERGSADVIV